MRKKQKKVNYFNNNLLVEEINYNVRYGFFKVGEAKLTIDSSLFYPNENSYFLISLEVRSVGLLNFFYSDLFLQYESYVSTDNNSYPFLTKRRLQHGKKHSENHDYFSYDDSLSVKTYSVNKDKERNFEFKNANKNIRDVLGTYLWYRQKDMSTVKSDTTYFFMAGKANNLIIKEVPEYDNPDIVKFQLLFPGVPDMPKKSNHYILVSKSGNGLIKVKVSMDVGNFYFVRSD